MPLLKDIQLSTFNCTRSLDKVYENEVILRRQNISLKCCKLLELLTHFRKGVRSPKYILYRVCRAKGSKVTRYQSWRSQKKICRPDPNLLEPVSPGSTLTWSRLFSKFDGQQLFSTLTYRPHINYYLISKYAKISRGLQSFKGGFCSVKLTSFS